MKLANTKGLRWKQISTCYNELSLEKTLYCGQAFRWKKILLDEQVQNLHFNPVYSCCLGGTSIKGSSSPSYWFALRHKNIDGEDSLGGVEFTLLGLENSKEQDHLFQAAGEMLKGYFNLTISLAEHWTKWQKDSNFREKTVGYEGLRVCTQPQTECIMSFICSSNNNISRITAMIDSFCKQYGTYFGTAMVDDKDGGSLHDFYAFPTLEELRTCTDTQIFKLGFGYRAKYIANSVQILLKHDNPHSYLENLRAMDYDKCRSKLMELSGIGPKVADCVALFSMNKHTVVPVDTHVLQIARRDYKVKVDKLNPTTYLLIGEVFRKVFGEHSGWAHSVLFAADLPDPMNKKSKKRAREE